MPVQWFRKLTINQWAALLTLLVGLYLEAVEWLDLYPWTTSFAITHGDNGQQSIDVITGIVLLAMASALWRGGRIVSVVSALLLGFWMWLQVTTWWIPYFTGASAGWTKVYAKWFAGTTQILPSWPGHYPPDANHFVLQLILAVAIGLCAASAFKKDRPLRR
jgi:hypothetical protein